MNRRLTQAEWEVIAESNHQRAEIDKVLASIPQQGAPAAPTLPRDRGESGGPSIFSDSPQLERYTSAAEELGRAEAEVAALRAENERLKAPVSDEERRKHGYKPDLDWMTVFGVNALIASRKGEDVGNGTSKVA